MVKHHNTTLRVKHKRERMLFILKYLKEHHCIGCGEDNPILLDFNHIRGKKTLEISYLVQYVYSYKRIVDEMAKCEVLCSNCHRKKTAWLV